MILPTVLHIVLYRTLPTVLHVVLFQIREIRTAKY